MVKYFVIVLLIAVALVLPQETSQTRSVRSPQHHGHGHHDGGHHDGDGHKHHVAGISHYLTKRFASGDHGHGGHDGGHHGHDSGHDHGHGGHHGHDHDSHGHH